MENNTVHVTPGSYEEKINMNEKSVLISFEPDPDYVTSEVDKAADTYTVVLQNGECEDGAIFFSSLDEIENFANELLEFAKRHKR